MRKTDFADIGAARWMPDGDVLVLGQQQDGRSLLAVASFDEKPLRTIGKPFVARLPDLDNPGLSPVSPDGRSVAVAIAAGTIVVVPLDGTDVKTVPGTGPNDLPIQWTADGRGLVVFTTGRLPAEIFEVDVATGKRAPVRELSPPVATGVSGLMRLVMTVDGRAYAATWEQFDSSLYLIRGLR